MAEQDKKQPSGADEKVTESAPKAPAAQPKEIGGRQGPEPTRYGDWEKKGIISDF